MVSWAWFGSWPTLVWVKIFDDSHHFDQNFSLLPSGNSRKLFVTVGNVRKCVSEVGGGLCVAATKICCGAKKARKMTKKSRSEWLRSKKLMLSKPRK